MKTARVGLTSNDIQFLKQAYSREPCRLSSNTLDLMEDGIKDSKISARTKQQIDEMAAFDAQRRKDNSYNAMINSLQQTNPPPQKVLVGGLLKNAELLDEEESHGFWSDRSARSTSSTYRSSARGSRSSTSRSTARSSRNLGTSRSVAHSVRALQSEKKQLEEELQQLSQVLQQSVKYAKRGPEMDSVRESFYTTTNIGSTAEDMSKLVKETKTPAEYESGLAYKLHMQRRYQTSASNNFVQPSARHLNTTKEHNRVATFAAKYGEALSKSKVSLRGNF